MSPDEIRTAPPARSIVMASNQSLRDYNDRFRRYAFRTYWIIAALALAGVVAYIYITSGTWAAVGVGIGLAGALVLNRRYIFPRLLPPEAKSRRKPPAVER